ncbi:V-set and immunoglobulin domain-containing protein 10-like [Polyodon spathula]|uniref:V-set and immunoglobulin domain-containing protein 10-like n=1 Tax=Polyodon spathula TaxID=7913 RepID=UPI001B7F40B1|nr:V-set and immunoglobulin domain-containing protein 10-like [Polyodon spathula]
MARNRCHFTCHVVVIQVLLVLLGEVQCVTITVLNPTVNAEAGTDAVLRVSFTSGTNPYVSWQLDLSIASWTINSSQPADIAVAYKGRLTIDTKAPSLTLNKVTTADSRVYKVSMQATGEPSDEKFVTLNVYENITSVFVSISPVDPVEGKNVTMTCQITGTGTEYSWMVNEAPITLDGRHVASGNTLTIKSLVRTDKGRYSCTAKNPINSLKNSTDLIVYYGPDDPVIKVDSTSAGKQQDALVGSTVQLDCVSESLPVSYNWIYSSVSTTGASKTLSNIQMSQQGDYICEVINAKTALTKRKTITINVYYIIQGLSVSTNPVIPKEGDAQLEIIYTTDKGSGTATWLKNGTALPNDPRYTVTLNSLKINSPNRSDSGVYTCNLNNPFSTSSVQKTISISYGPEKPQISVTSLENPDPLKYVLVGTTVLLKCKAEGAPPATYYWNLGNQDDPSVPEGATLNLTNIQANQTGIYNCIAVNDKTNMRVRSVIPLNVYQKPASAGPTCSMTPVNSDLQFHCSWLEGIPKASLKFLGLSEVKQASETLDQTETAAKLPALNGKEIICVGTHPIAPNNCSITPSSPEGILPSLNATAQPSGIVSVTISCKGSSQPPAKVTWSKAEQLLTPGGIYTISSDTTDLTITGFNISGGDLTTYTCVSTNLLGSQKSSINLTGPVISKSSIFVNPAHTMVTLTWETPRDSVVTGFNVQMTGPALQSSSTSRAASDWTTIQTMGPEARSTDISPLQPGEIYQFRVIPMVGQNKGPPSETYSLGQDPGLSAGAITGIVIGSVFGFLLLLLLLLLLILCCLRRKKQRKEPKYPAPQSNERVATGVSQPNVLLTGGVASQRNGPPIGNGNRAYTPEPYTQYDKSSTLPSSATPSAVRMATTV